MRFFEKPFLNACKFQLYRFFWKIHLGCNKIKFNAVSVIKISSLVTYMSINIKCKIRTLLFFNLLPPLIFLNSFGLKLQNAWKATFLLCYKKNWCARVKKTSQLVLSHIKAILGKNEIFWFDVVEICQSFNIMSF